MPYLFSQIKIADNSFHTGGYQLMALNGVFHCVMLLYFEFDINLIWQYLIISQVLILISTLGSLRQSEKITKLNNNYDVCHAAYVLSCDQHVSYLKHFGAKHDARKAVIKDVICFFSFMCVLCMLKYFYAQANKVHSIEAFPLFHEQCPLLL